MESFRTELENPIVQKDIIDLERKIREFREGKLHDEKFRSLRLARGIYGQRQPGVQMIRIKLPFGKVTFRQLLKIADISDEYASSNLHLTTRQDIQIHYVSLDRTPELWAKLEQDDITLREACGNTVRNVTASPSAGIDPNEPFDVAPYAHATFKYFLRNPICQEMGRKFKIAFSATEADTAFSYIHDLGFIPKLIIKDGEEIRGFKVLFGGGLGAQPAIAHPINEFLHEDDLIPYIESTLRVFDRHGERNNRNKARMKFLVAKLGLEEVLRLIDEEKIANNSKKFVVDRETIQLPEIPEVSSYPDVIISNPLHYESWLKTNVFEQKQKGFYGVYIKVTTGDIPTAKARKFIDSIRGLVADEIRITINQGLLLKFVRPEALPLLFERLKDLDFAKPGFDSVADVTTCPGTDTCNLGISNSTELARVLEDLIADEYEDLVDNQDIKIKISGCMNSCGQHGLAHIGFHGSSLKAAGKVVPAAQVLLGGGTIGDGLGRAADKVIKVPSKRTKDVVRVVLNNYSQNKTGDELFNDFYDRLGKDHFYQLLKPIADLATLTPDEFVDWGHEETFVTAIGVGECAGVVIDLVSTLVLEAEEKLQWSISSFENKAYSDSLYHAYSVFISGAKALLLDKGINSSTQTGIMRDFDEQYKHSPILEGIESFTELALQINKNEPTAEFAQTYLAATVDFIQRIKLAKEEVQL
ncbi:HEPN domain-containing protein [Daejeonella sp.]|uniref:HEPN domain-containing protein n=1 Tax=Daejeonella sp. TaxID=2805397 RepID=UPI003983C3AF